MHSNFFDQQMYLYSSGVFDGIVYFGRTPLMISRVDPRTRFTQTPVPYQNNDTFLMPMETIHEKWKDYIHTKWEGESVILSCGDIYARHITIKGQKDGEICTGQVWAQRKSNPAIDVITVDGKIIAFLYSNRYGMEVAVIPGYEALTPLYQYDDPLLSKPNYGVNCLGIHQAAMRDGVKLAQYVYIPNTEDPQATFPTILVRSCYTKERFTYKLSKYVNKGYALVMQDIRGRGDSEGDLDPFAFERDDSDDTINWIVSQPWSNGIVGTWGASYLGHVVVQGATSGNPHLKAAINEVNVGSPFIDTVRRGGALCSQTLLCWALAQSSGQRPDMIYMSDTIDLNQYVHTRPLTEVVKAALGTPANDLWEKWTTYDEENAWWKRSNFSLHGQNIKAPMLVISGWYDGDGLGVSETWRLLTKYDVPGRRIILGPWEHAPNTTRDVETVALGNNAIIYHFDITNLRWFDHYLKNIDNGIDREPRATYYVVGENKWHTSDDWAPSESEVVNFYLDSDGHANSCHGDGRMTMRCPETLTSDTYVYDPSTPFVDLVSNEVGLRSPINYKGHELRSDMLVYTSAPFSKDLIIAGEISAEFFASSSARDTDFILRLTEVDEADNSLKLSENIIRAKYRNRFETIELLEPNQIEKYTLNMESNGYLIPKGHRIRLQILSSSENLVFPNTNTGNHPFTDMEMVVATNRIYHGKKYPSHMKLPILKHQ